MAEREGSVPPYMDATAMGPVHDIDATDLHGAGTAPNDVRYSLSPCEQDAWQFAVGQAGQVISECHAGAGSRIADMSTVEGPYDAGTTQPGVPVYGMAGG